MLENSHYKRDDGQLRDECRDCIACIEIRSHDISKPWQWYFGHEMDRPAIHILDCAFASGGNIEFRCVFTTSAMTWATDIRSATASPHGSSAAPAARGGKTRMTFPKICQQERGAGTKHSDLPNSFP
jgi:hypothetical protein